MPAEKGQGLVSAVDGEVQFSPEGQKFLVDMIDGLKPEVKEPEAKNEPPKETQKEPEKEPVKPEEPKVEPEVKTEKRKFKDLKVDGEVKELEIDETEEKELLQKGLHYTKEMQALREKERSLTPYEALIKQLQTDPALNQHIAGYFAKGKEPEKAPTFDDPIEQLKYEIKQETRKEILGEIKKDFVEPMSRQQVISRVAAQVQADPMFNEIQGEIINYVKSQPPLIGRTLAMQLDQDPNAYMEVFAATKERLMRTKKEPELPKPIKKEEKAPILESGGSTQPQTSDTKKKEKIDKARAKAFHDNTTESLAAYLQEGGFINNLL